MGKIQTEFTGVVKNAKMIWLACLFLPALLFWLAWEPMPFTPLVFIAFVPFFYLMDWGFGVSKGKNYMKPFYIQEELLQN